MRVKENVFLMFFIQGSRRNLYAHEIEVNGAPFRGVYLNFMSTSDNPGWSITINLEDTELENQKFQEIEIERFNDNWLCCFVDNNKFEGRCGPLNLPEVLQTFHDWTESGEKESLL